MPLQRMEERRIGIPFDFDGRLAETFFTEPAHGRRNSTRGLVGTEFRIYSKALVPVFHRRERGFK
jgi:hypothetical protein